MTSASSLGYQQLLSTVALLPRPTEIENGAVVDSIVQYKVQDSVATITLDDGKVNALSPRMQSEVNSALDRAENDHAVVILTGRDGVFSAGFDLKVIRSGGEETLTMLRGGFALAERLLSFPTPVIVSCTGHALAMGVFLLLCGDYRIGVAGPYRIAANEVAIGMTVPRAAIEIVRQRLTPAAVNRSIVLAETFSPESALAAGFIDQLVEPSLLAATGQTLALDYTKLDMRAHVESKLRLRAGTLAAIRAGVLADFGEPS